MYALLIHPVCVMTYTAVIGEWERVNLVVRMAPIFYITQYGTSKNLRIWKRSIIIIRMEGRQDRDGIHEAWLMNRFEHADTPTPSHNPYIVAWCATRKLHLYSITVATSK